MIDNYLCFDGYKNFNGVWVTCRLRHLASRVVKLKNSRGYELFVYKGVLGDVMLRRKMSYKIHR
jgi:hypothetical protein